MATPSAAGQPEAEPAPSRHDAEGQRELGGGPQGTAPSGRAWHCDACQRPYPECDAPCPRRLGWRRTDIAEALVRGEVVPGLSPDSPLVGETRARFGVLASDLEQQVAEARRALQVRLEMLDEIRRRDARLADFQRTGPRGAR